MQAITGSALVVKWVYGSATATLTGDQRTYGETPSIDLVDQTAGADTNKSYIATVKDGRSSFGAVFQGGTATGGTATFVNLVSGYVGTLIVQPQGGGTSLPIGSIPAICMGAVYSYPYAGLIEMTCEFQWNGPLTAGTN